MTLKGTFACAQRTSYYLKVIRMAPRGSNSFKRNDAIRAIRSAKDAGMSPSMMEVVVAADGSVTYRVYGEDAVPARSGGELSGVSKEWQTEIDRLKKLK
jgi:hypothetical protein